MTSIANDPHLYDAKKKIFDRLDELEKLINKKGKPKRRNWLISVNLNLRIFLLKEKL